MRPIVTQESVSRLPRIGLFALCLLYGVPGFFAHDPWRDAETAALIKMLQGPLSALDLTTLLGTLSIQLFSPMLDAAIAARIPFLLLLWGSFAMLWYACYHFARQDAAQPATLPFGGQAQGVDYARAVADGSLLAFMACLGLAEKGHQATALLGQLFGMCVLLYGVASHSHEPVKSPVALLLSALLLFGFGAPGFAMYCYITLALLHLTLAVPSRRLLLALQGTAGLSGIAWAFSQTSEGTPLSAQSVSEWLSLMVWFLWPAWLIVAVGIWRLRAHRVNSDDAVKHAPLLKRLQWHLSVPLFIVILACARALVAPDQDDALFIALPPLAICAALMLALMPRSMLAAIDWFALALFTGAALFVWLLWTAAQTGTPTPISNNIERFYPGFRAAQAWPFQSLMFLIATAATIGWLALMVWRTSRARKPLWKGMVLTAGGVTLTWLLLQTLGAPMLNASRTYAPLVVAIDKVVDTQSCIRPINIGDTQRFLLSWKALTRYEDKEQCPYALVRHSRLQAANYYLPEQGWALQATLRRPTERDESFSLFKRLSAATKPGAAP